MLRSSPARVDFAVAFALSFALSSLSQAQPQQPAATPANPPSQQQGSEERQPNEIERPTAFEQGFGSRGGRGGRGGRGRQRGGIEASESFGGGFSEFTPGAAEQSVDAPAANQPMEIVQLRLWALSIHVPSEKAADQLVASLGESVNNLPQNIDSLDKVRELIAKLTEAKILHRSREFRFSAANGQLAQITLGSQEPMITNTSTSPRGGGRTSNYQYQAVGTTIQATARLVSGENIRVGLTYEASSLEPTDPPVVVSEPENGKSVSIPQIISQRVQTNVRFKRGGATVVQADTTAEPKNGGVRLQLLILGGIVVPESN